MDTLPLVSLGLGFILGVRHAMDPDHVAAVSALLSQHRSLARSCLLGTFWGVGHTMALLAAGVAVIVFKLTISPEVAKGMEMAVAVVLILLGGHVLRRSLGVWSFHRHEHSHDGRPHSHFHLHASTEDSPGHIHLLKGGGRPFLVGFVHGMAGSAALMLLVLTAIPSPVRAFLYILVFGIGSTAGMLVLSGLIGIPFVVTADRSRQAHAAIQALAGAASLILGLALAWNLGVTAFV